MRGVEEFISLRDVNTILKTTAAAAAGRATVSSDGRDEKKQVELRVWWLLWRSSLNSQQHSIKLERIWLKDCAH